MNERTVYMKYYVVADVGTHPAVTVFLIIRAANSMKMRISHLFTQMA